MINYDEHDVNILEQIKDGVEGSSIIGNIINKSDVYLEEIPERYIDSELLVRLNYVDLRPSNFGSDGHHSEVVSVQVDVWKEGRKTPLSESNVFRDYMRSLGFVQVGSSMTLSSDKDLGKKRDSRRYTRGF